ncbi:hypothetical protein BJX96DRAFT_155506, partial [Aspergillus floccosus]
MSPKLHKRDSLQGVSLATQIVCIGIITCFVALRYIAKYKLKLRFGIEDVLCFIAWVFYMGHCACSLTFTYLNGTVATSGTMEPDRMESKFKVFYICAFFYVSMILFVKLTLLSLIIRIFQPHPEKVAIVYAFTALIICYYIAIIFAKIFICSPIHAYWQDWRNVSSTKRCLNRPAIIIADSSISVATDLAILVFPLALSWSLHMPFSKKAGVVTILGAGCIAIGFSLYRLVLVSVGSDPPGQIAVILRILLTDNAEGGIGLICACLPPFNKFVRDFVQKWRENRKPPVLKADEAYDEARILRSSNRASITPETNTEGPLETWPRDSLGPL